MICANCGTENRAGRRFCLQCGNALARACPNCGASNEAEARFCGGCGNVLEATATVAASAPTAAASVGSGRPSPAPVAERRLVTVLFADLVGFTPFAEERDPEQVRDTLTRFFDIARDAIVRHGGTVEKFIGDAVMAVWGTPVAHEDDAERAVRAALELTDGMRALGDGIQARAGLLTGEAAVTLGATDQGMVAGDLVNTAARLQAVAPDGAVLVGETTMRASQASVAFEPAGDHILKGKSSPVPAWRALRVIAQRGGAGRTEAVETPFVGRDQELRLLKDLVAQTGRDPRPRLVSVSGPAGIGKSRLAWELKKYVDGLVETVYWHRGRCPSYGEGITFWALGEMVRTRCGLAEGDDEPITRAGVAETVARHVTVASERDWIAGALLALLGVDPTPSGGREMLFAAWRRFFESVAAGGITVLVFEDLQWADPGLLDFIDHLLGWSKGAPLLVLTLARPELFDRRPDWGAGRAGSNTMALEPLTPASMRELLAGLVPDLPEPVIRAVVERSGGTPLYAVEIIRMLIGEGGLEPVAGGGFRATTDLATLPVPETLRSLIGSRLDALDPADRALLQDASVLGLSFTLDALAQIAGIDPAALGPRLDRLVRRELLTVEADPRSPERGQYVFVQSLIREVTYATLARPERRARHLAAARTIEASAGDESAAVLAGHYLAAYQASTPGAEADAIAAQARVSLRAAAERAASLGSHEQAAEFLEQALDVTTDVAEQAALVERRASELDVAGHYDVAEPAARAAIDRYATLNDIAGRARARGVLGTILIHAGRIPEAVVELDGAVADLPEDADLAVRADALAKLARALYRNLMYERSLEIADRALVIAEHNGLRRTLADAMISKGTVLNMLARPHEAIALLRAGVELARKETDVPNLLRGMANLTPPVGINEGPELAQPIAEEALALATTVGDVGQITWQLANVMFGVFLLARPLDPAIAQLEDVMARQLAAADRLSLADKLVLLRGLRGDDVETDLIVIEAEIRAGNDPQRGPDVRFARLARDIARGDYRIAAQEAAEINRSSPAWNTFNHAVWCAAVAGDPRQAASLLEELEALPLRGRSDEAMRVIARAAAAAVNGNTDEALTLFRRGLHAIGD